MAKKKDEPQLAKMERPAPWPDPPERCGDAPEADWSGRRFVHRLVEVDAVQIHEPMTIETPFGPICGSIGDWLVIGEGGQQWFCTDEYFRLNYEPVADKRYIPAVDSTSRH